jgi:hypothetical protein
MISMGLGLVSLLVGLLCGQGPVDAGGHMLRVLPPEMDVEAVVATIDEEDLPVGILVIDVCRSGQALFDPPEGPFVAREGFEDGEQLARWIELAHAAGIQVYAGMDLLQWWMPESKDPNPFDQHPSLLELGPNLACDPGSEGAYASPWSGKVRQALSELLRQLALEYPEIDGLYIESGLSVKSVLGFSIPAREAAIHAIGLDPVDLPIYGVHENEYGPLREWMVWRKASTTEFLNEVKTAFRSAHPNNGPIVARVPPAVAAYRLRYQAVSCQDWVQWLFTGAVDDLVMEIDLGRGGVTSHEEFMAGYAVYEELITDGLPLLLVPGELGGRAVSLPWCVEKMDAMDLPQVPLCLDPYVPRQVDKALDVLRVLRDNRR